MANSCDICAVAPSDATFVLIAKRTKVKCPECQTESWHEACLDRIAKLGRGVQCKKCSASFAASRIGMLRRFLTVWLFDTPLWPPTFMQLYKPKQQLPRAQQYALRVTMLAIYAIYATMLCVTVGSWIEAMITAWNNTPPMEGKSWIVQILYLPTASLALQKHLYTQVVKSETMTNVARASRMMCWILLANAAFKFFYLFGLLHIRIPIFAPYYIELVKRKLGIVAKGAKLPVYTEAPPFFGETEKFTFVLIEQK